MTVQDINMERPTGAAEPRRDASGRVIEWEFRMPRAEIKAPEVDLEPARRVAEKVLLVGIGATVLLARGISSAVKSAASAGAEAAEHPGPVTRTLLDLVRPRPQKAAPARETRVKVPVVPIEGYDALTGEEAIARLEALSADELRTLRDYEAATQARDEVLQAIDQRLNA